MILFGQEMFSKNVKKLPATKPMSVRPQAKPTGIKIHQHDFH